MNAEEIALSLLEDEELTLESAKEIFDWEGLDNEDIREMEIYTMYNSYKGFGDGYTMLIKDEDFHNFVKETCDEFAQCLPDKFDVYFNSKELYEDIMGIGGRGSADKVALQQAQDFMVECGRDVCLVKPKWEYSKGDNLLIEVI